MNVWTRTGANSSCVGKILRRIVEAAVPCMCVAAPAAHAGSTWTVNNTGDPASGTASNCSAGNPNTCAVRDAIAAAGSGDTIGFNVGSGQTITLVSGNPLGVAASVAIDGADSPGLVIDGNNTTTVFYVTGIDVSISDLSIAHAKSNFLNANPYFNYADAGGIANLGSLALNRIRISHCTASGIGGGVYNGGMLSIIDSTISDNTAGTGGGGILNFGTLVLTNSTVSGNFNDAIRDTGTLTMTNSTISSNPGDGLVRYAGAATLTNSTLVGNGGKSIILAYNPPPPVPPGPAGTGTPTATLTNSLVDTCLLSNVSASALVDAGGNLDAGTSCLGAIPASASSKSNANLALGPLRDNGGPTPTALPGPASDAIDRGLDSVCAAAPVNGLDQRGVVRPQGAHCDAGAVEARLCYVKYDAAGNDDGSSWTDAYPDLQFGLADSGCDAVLVARGFYRPTALSDRSISFNVRPGLGLYGGYSGIGTQRDPAMFRTVLSGDIDLNDGGANGIDTDAAQIAGNNSYHVVVIDGTTVAGPVGPDTILDGFTITAGAADGGYPASFGGGLLCYGGGATCSPTLTNLVFSGNRAQLGGGIYNFGEGGTSNPLITNATFRGNAAVDGSAIYDDGAFGTSSPLLANVTFTANTASDCGAIFDDATQFGVSSPDIRNATFAGNIGTGNGGSAICDFTLTGVNATSLVNSIAWNNTDPAISTYSGGATLDHVVTDNGCPSQAACSNLLAGDPLLGPLQDNGGPVPTVMIGDTGAANDAGADATCAAAPVAGRDARGIARPQGAHCDIGAVEATNLALTVSDGSGFGAYGKASLYVVTLQNKSATGTASGIRLQGYGTAALDEPGTLWFCTIGTCTTTQTSGPLADTATLAPNSTLTWLVSTPVYATSTESSATLTIRSSGAGSAADTDTLVIFRGTFDGN